MNTGPFDNLPILSKRNALQILATEVTELTLSSDYYKAAFHLSKYPGPETEEALINLLASKNPEQAYVLGRRMAVQTLARLGCLKAIPLIGSCLYSDDNYLIENAAWALMELDCQDNILIGKLISLLDDNNKNRRVIIKCLSALEILSSLDKIQKLSKDPSLSVGERCAAISAVIKLTGDKSQIAELHHNLKNKSQNERHCAVLDLIDTNDPSQLPHLLHLTVSPSFRLKAVSKLWPEGHRKIGELDLLNIIEMIIIDNPKEKEIVNQNVEYIKTVDLIEGLFSTDFDRAYLSLNRLIDKDTEELWPIILRNLDRLKKDYGAIYFFMLLFTVKTGWSQDALQTIEDLTLYALSNQWPEYMKFKPLAILLLMDLNPEAFGLNFRTYIDSVKTPFWASRYAALMSLDRLTERVYLSDLMDIIRTLPRDCNSFVNEKMKDLIDHNRSE